MSANRAQWSLLYCRDAASFIKNCIFDVRNTAYVGGGIDDVLGLDAEDFLGYFDAAWNLYKEEKNARQESFCWA